MRFFNLKTGATIDLPLDHLGGEWIPETERAQEQTEETNQRTEYKPEREIPEQGEITKKDIMRELDAFGVEYNPKARKEELYQLMKERLHADNHH